MMINQTRLLLIFHSSCPYTFIPFGQMTSFPPFFVHSLCHCVLFLLSLFAKKVDRYKKNVDFFGDIKDYYYICSGIALKQYCYWQYPCLIPMPKALKNAGWEGKGTTYIKGVYQTFVLDELKLRTFLIQSAHCIGQCEGLSSWDRQRRVPTFFCMFEITYYYNRSFTGDTWAQTYYYKYVVRISGHNKFFDRESYMGSPYCCIVHRLVLFHYQELV